MFSIAPFYYENSKYGQNKQIVHNSLAIISWAANPNPLSVSIELVGNGAFFGQVDNGL